MANAKYCSKAMHWEETLQVVSCNPRGIGFGSIQYLYDMENVTSMNTKIQVRSPATEIVKALSHPGHLLPLKRCAVHAIQERPTK